MWFLGMHIAAIFILTTIGNLPGLAGGTTSNFTGCVDRSGSYYDLSVEVDDGNPQIIASASSSGTPHQ